MCVEDEGPVERSRPHKAYFSLHSAKGKLQPQSASNLPGVRKAALPGAPGQVPALAYLWLFFRYSMVGPCMSGYLPRGEIVPEKGWAPFPKDTGLFFWWVLLEDREDSNLNMNKNTNSLLYIQRFKRNTKYNA